MMQSLSARLLMAVCLLLLIFFGITVYVLDLSFRSAAEEAVRERLDVHAIALLSFAEPENGSRLALPQPLPESQFENPGSGLFGSLTRQGGDPIWRSGSLVGTGIDFPQQVPTGERIFRRMRAADGSEIFALSLGIEWQLSGSENLPLIVNVAESISAFNAQVNSFRRQLFGWFAGLMVLLLTAQAVLLGWVLAPLRRAENEVRAIEQGELASLSADYPRELSGLTRHTNILLDTERARVARYRDTLGNLAHSIKTPLAVIRNSVTNLEAQGSEGRIIDEQVSRIQQIVDYQLKRATATRGSLSIHAVDVRAVLEELLTALGKVHDKPGLEVILELEDNLKFLGDRGDFLEILGNLLDNAYKWADSKIRIKSGPADQPLAHGHAMDLIVEDDGPGIPDAWRDLVMSRGGRADEQVEGHGIGLAVVRETVKLLGGSIAIDRSALGGARVALRLPAR